MKLPKYVQYSAIYFYTHYAVNCIREWLNREIEDESNIQDEVCHNPKYHIKKPKIELKQTDHGFIEMPETK